MPAELPPTSGYTYAAEFSADEALAAGATDVQFDQPLYFYPEDDTQVCTVQACNLRDNYAELKKHGITILGVSPNDEKSHKKFEAKFNLPFTLLVDDDLKIANKYGVWAEKVLYGNRHMGIVRSTYLINEDGKIHHIIKRALSKIHTQQILKGFGLV